MSFKKLNWQLLIWTYIKDRLAVLNHVKFLNILILSSRNIWNFTSRRIATLLYGLSTPREKKKRKKTKELKLRACTFDERSEQSSKPCRRIRNHNHHNSKHSNSRSNSSRNSCIAPCVARRKAKRRRRRRRRRRR